MKSLILVALCAVLGMLPIKQAMAIIGNVDGFYSDGNGNPVVSGWTCQVGNPNSIQVDLYLNQPYSPPPAASGQFINRSTANRPSEPAVASQCGTRGTNYRFAITIPGGILAGSQLYIYGVISAGGTQLSAANTFKVPANTASLNNPGSVSIGSGFVIYDTFYDSNPRCAPLIDIPLYPVTFPSQDNKGVVVLFPTVSDDGKNSNYLVSGQVDASGSETHDFHVNCTPVLASPQSPVSGDFRGNQWLAGFFKNINGDVFSLIHNEYYGGRYPTDNTFTIPASNACNLGQTTGTPISAANCTYAALDMAKMSAGSSSFQLLGSAPPQQVVAQPSFPYTSSSGMATGYFTNTNPILNSDGYYYALTIDILPSGSQHRCPIRASDIANPSTWRGWDGSGFTTNVSRGVDCVSSGYDLAGIFPFYLSYSTYYNKAIMVGAINTTSDPNSPIMIAYSVSSDYVHWSQPVSFNVPVFNIKLSPGPGWTDNNYPSLVDVVAIQNSQSPNSSTGAIVGQGPWLVFKQRYVCTQPTSGDANCPVTGNVPRTRYTAVAVGFSQ